MKAYLARMTSQAHEEAMTLNVEMTKGYHLLTS